MKTIELSGTISFEYDTWDKLKLVQEDGYKIDLITRFVEAYESFPSQKVQVNYWIHDRPCTKQEITEGFLKKLYGAIDANYESNDYCYSSWTSGTDYDTSLSIGGHDLYRELKDKVGKFMIIELNFKQSDNEDRNGW